MARGTPDATGVVLAGGYSRRFGETDKALARVGGEPLLARVVARLGEVAETVVVNCRADQRSAFEDALGATGVPVRYAEDPAPDRGPLLGFRTALRRVETEACLLVACDAPFLDPRLLSDLLGRLGTGEAERGVENGDRERAEVVAVRTPADRVHPTQAAYRTAPTSAAAADLLDAGERRLSAVSDSLALRTVPADEVAGDAARSFFDVDTPEDRVRAVEMLGKREGEKEREEDEERKEGDEEAEVNQEVAVPR